MTSKPITISETKMFERAAARCMTEGELDEFKDYISINPEVGKIIRGTGGVRKVRWATGNKGKSGGVRVIYYFMDLDNPLFLLTVFSKSSKASLTDAQKQAMKAVISGIKEDA